MKRWLKIYGSLRVRKSELFGKFLKDIQDKISKADVLNKFPYRQGELPGPVGTINDLTIIGLVDGMGKAEKLAMSKHKDIDSESAAWAWLLASNKAAGQEWHFSPNARERGSLERCCYSCLELG